MVLVSRIVHYSPLECLISPKAALCAQVHRSVKYMTAAEREARREEVEGRREVRIVNGEIRGEWELEHVYMCAACAEPFDELREVSNLSA